MGMFLAKDIFCEETKLIKMQQVTCNILYEEFRWSGTVGVGVSRYNCKGLPCKQVVGISSSCTGCRRTPISAVSVICSVLRIRKYLEN